MTAQETLEKAAEVTGWNADSMLEIARRYIDNQASPEAFNDFVEQEVAGEVAVTEEPSEDIVMITPPDGGEDKL